MPNNNSHKLDYFEILPPSSSALKENLDQVLDHSQNWNAALTSLDQKTGTYRIVLQGTLSPELQENKG